MVRKLREFSLSVLMATALFLGIDTVTARNFIDGPSMEPNLHKEQRMIVSRLGISGPTQLAFAAARLGDVAVGEGWVPPRGSICTFRHPEDPSRVLVKRVIGLPGEEISVVGGVVYIDGEPLSEPYLLFRDARNLARQRVPVDALFMMGDNRPVSGDSRLFGPVPRANLLGMAVLRYWPLSEFELLLARP